MTRLLTNQFLRIGILFRPELLHAAAKNFGRVKVPLLIHSERVRALELSRQSTGPAPAIQIVAVQIVLEDAMRAAVGHPKELVGADEVRIRQRSHTGGEHVQELAVLVEDLEAAMCAVDHEQPAVITDGDAVNGVELVGSGSRGIPGWTAPVHQELAIAIELGHARAAVSVGDEEGAVR